jgi:AmmeMemoRadiSam system protein A
MTKEEQVLLLRIVRDSLKLHFGQHDSKATEEVETKKPAALLESSHGAFVTLHECGNLRGCIGYMIGDRPLYRLVGMLALETAFKDYRFQPLREEELPLCSIEISVLSAPKEINDLNEFIPGRDGIIMYAAGGHAVFLPQVAPEQGWGREETLVNLCWKAGLPSDVYKKPDTRFETFTAEVFSE